MTSAARPRMTIAAPLLRGGGELLGAHDVGEAVCELASAGLLDDCAPRRRTFPSPPAPPPPVG